MRVLAARQKLALVAVASAGAALLAACNQPPATDPGPAGTGGIGSGPDVGPTLSYKVGSVLVSNGTTSVKVGDETVTFPTKVSDAAFSHDGSRIAFVDGDGNIATAHPNGTGLLVLTKKKDGVTRSSPTWYGNDIVYTYRDKSTTRLFRTESNGGNAWSVEPTREIEQEFYPSSDDSPNNNTAPSASAGPGDGYELAFQHTGSAGAEVWVADTNQRSPYSEKITAGAAAEISPNGKRVAFVAPNGQVAIIDVEAGGDKVENAKPVQVTFGVDTPSHLAWSSDGSRIAYGTKTGVESVSAKPDSATANKATPHSSTPGVPTFAPLPIDRFARITSDDPVEAAIIASQLRFPKQEAYSPGEGSKGAFAAFITAAKGAGTSTETLVPFISGGAPGPVLFTSGSSLDKRTKAELQRLFGTITPGYGPQVTILGDTDVVPAQVDKDLKALGYATMRIAAADLSTSGLPERAFAGQRFLVVDLEDPAGVAAAGAYINSLGATIITSSKGVLTARAKALLNTLTGPATITPLDSAGEQAARADWPGKPKTITVTATIGTNADRLRHFGTQTRGVVLVDRSSTKDVLQATSLANSLYYVVLAVDGAAPLDPEVAAWLDGASGSLNQLLVVDSAGKVGNDAIQGVMKSISSPLGFAETPPGKA